MCDILPLQYWILRWCTVHNIDAIYKYDHLLQQWRVYLEELMEFSMLKRKENHVDDEMIDNMLVLNIVFLLINNNIFL